MLRTRPFAEVRAELADEHRQVMALVERIQAPCTAQELPDLLSSLHDLLVDHFAHEQFPGGLYESMGAHLPEHHDTLRILIREHCEILSAVRALVERRRNGIDVGSDSRADVAEVIDRLHQHETREHELARRLAPA